MFDSKLAQIWHKPNTRFYSTLDMPPAGRISIGFQVFGAGIFEAESGVLAEVPPIKLLASDMCATLEHT